MSSDGLIIEVTLSVITETEGDCSRTPSQPPQQQHHHHHCPHCHLLILNEVFVIDRNTLSTFSSRPVQTSVHRARVGVFEVTPVHFDARKLRPIPLYSLEASFHVTSPFPAAVVVGEKHSVRGKKAFELVCVAQMLPKLLIYFFFFKKSSNFTSLKQTDLKETGWVQHKVSNCLTVISVIKYLFKHFLKCQQKKISTASSLKTSIYLCIGNINETK